MLAEEEEGPENGGRKQLATIWGTEARGMISLVLKVGQWGFGEMIDGQGGCDEGDVNSGGGKRGCGMTSFACGRIKGL